MYSVVFHPSARKLVVVSAGHYIVGWIVLIVVIITETHYKRRAGSIGGEMLKGKVPCGG